jgi:hypothetical protein
MNNEEMRDKRIIDRQRDEAPEIELVTRGHAASLNCNPDYECGPDSCAPTNPNCTPSTGCNPDR